jgi:hypothetical protein
MGHVNKESLIMNTLSDESYTKERDFRLSAMIIHDPQVDRYLLPQI